MSTALNQKVITWIAIMSLLFELVKKDQCPLILYISGVIGKVFFN